jgi:UTP:GlnB (protein PII) uridylyltransferase
VFADQRLDIRHARIATLGDNVVDTFYLRESDGSKIAAARRRCDIEQSLLAVLR